MTRAPLKFLSKQISFFCCFLCGTTAKVGKVDLMVSFKKDEQVPALQLELVFSTLRQEVAALGFVNRRA